MKIVLATTQIDIEAVRGLLLDYPSFLSAANAS